MITRPLLAFLLASAALPALAADPPSINQRVDKVERELRAVQRKVFPGGTPAFTEPEIAAAAPAAQAGEQAQQPIAELGGRVDTLERELARLTGQIEQIDHRLTLLSQQAAQDRSEFDTRLKTIEAGAPPATAPAASAAAPAADSPFRTPPTTRPPRLPRLTTPEVAPVAEPVVVPPVAAGGDAAEAGYMAGYRLWADKKYAEAEDMLGKVAAQYPKHRRASYARNLQGRAFLDDGQPAEAARILFTNYQKDPRGERAPESLFYLGSALTQLKKYDEACKAYGELDAVYSATMGDTLKGRLPAARKAARCGDADADAPAPAKSAAKTSATKKTK